MLKIASGLTAVDLPGKPQFSIDLVEWVEWYREATRNGGDYVKAAIAKLKDECGVELNHTEADELVDAIVARYREVKKKRWPEPASQPATESIPSP